MRSRKSVWARPSSSVEEIQWLANPDQFLPGALKWNLQFNARYAVFEVSDARQMVWPSLVKQGSRGSKQEAAQSARIQVQDGGRQVLDGSAGCRKSNATD